MGETYPLCPVLPDRFQDSEIPRQFLAKSIESRGEGDTLFSSRTISWWRQEGKDIEQEQREERKRKGQLKAQSSKIAPKGKVIGSASKVHLKPKLAVSKVRGMEGQGFNDDVFSDNADEVEEELEENPEEEDSDEEQPDKGESEQERGDENRENIEEVDFDVEPGRDGGRRWGLGLPNNGSGNPVINKRGSNENQRNQACANWLLYDCFCFPGFNPQDSSQPVNLPPPRVRLSDWVVGHIVKLHPKALTGKQMSMNWPNDFDRQGNILQERINRGTAYKKLNTADRKYYYATYAKYYILHGTEKNNSGLLKMDVPPKERERTINSYKRTGDWCKLNVLAVIQKPAEFFSIDPDRIGVLMEPRYFEERHCQNIANMLYTTNSVIPNGFHQYITVGQETQQQPALQRQLEQPVQQQLRQRVQDQAQQRVQRQTVQRQAQRQAQNQARTPDSTKRKAPLDFSDREISHFHNLGGLNVREKLIFDAGMALWEACPPEDRPDELDFRRAKACTK